MSGVLVEQFIASFDQPPSESVLDFDPSDLPVHGQQEGRFFHGFHGHYCFLPLYVFCGSRLPVACLPCLGCQPVPLAERPGPRPPS
jgi:hypothetical protein